MSGNDLVRPTPPERLEILKETVNHIYDLELGPLYMIWKHSFQHFSPRLSLTE